MENNFNVESECLGELGGSQYRLKVSVFGLGLFIFGFRASRSDRNPGGWWIQEPAIKTKDSGWKKNPEFDKKQTLWKEIEASCSKTMDDYFEVDKSANITDEDLTEEALDKSLDDAFKAFGMSETGQ